MTTTLIRDRDGIAHVRAGDEAGAFRGQGLAATEDRLWQMEFDRRKALGRLAEVVGPTAVAADRYHLRLGVARTARSDVEHLDDRTLAMLHAYAEGVNVALDDAGELPPEFGLLGAPRPAPWEAWHSIAVFKVRHLWMGTAEVKLWRSAVASVLGPELAARLWPSTPGVHIDPARVDAPVDEGLASAIAEASDVLEAIGGLGDRGGASNNFVVHSARTSTGAPIMAGDPHRAIDLPNVYWQNHVRWPSADIIGLSFPGVPGFPHFGHNERVAWSITHGMADDQDLFLEHLRRGPDGIESRRGDAWLPVERRTEEIPVAGAPNQVVECLETPNGAVVAGGVEDGRGISLAWTATAAPDTTAACLLPQMLATSVDDLDRAFTDWVVPCNNVLTADVDGSVAYRFRGRLAVRDQRNGWTVADGSDPATSWTGFVPDDQLVRVREPERGFLVTANNPIGADHFISHDWAHPARSLRLTALLADHDAMAPADALALLGDTHSAVAAAFARRIVALDVRSGPERLAQALLADWDHHMDADQCAPTIYATTRAELVRLLAERLRVQEAPVVAGLGYTLGQATRALHIRAAFLIEDEDVVTDALLATSFRNAVHALVQERGADAETWRWGDGHTAGFHHPLAALRPDLTGALARPTAVPLGGDNECVWAAGTVPPSLRSVTSPVARYVFDLADWDRSGWIVPHGVQGDPRGDHHDDQLRRWADVELSPMRYSTAAVDADTASVTDLG